MKTNKDPLITLEEAALLTGRSQGALKKWIRRGHVNGFVTGSGWLVRQSELLAAHDRIKVIRRQRKTVPPALRVIEQVPLISKPAPAASRAAVEQLGVLTVSLAVLRHKHPDEIEPALFGHLKADLQWLLSKLQ
tara:strand:+ start:1552 stop:1953 length:402 start_codon:yes stop_codon:yes gene_type:complete